ncbi:AraC family transcriptional regulator [Vibrio salinus]|uniref:AraC family transcriptional regulator n=1 Tax=Vibrio salinus TaxID=2899784 RepID=UPI001E2A1663|nr:AraC family transcriptional regulator [Vibrio salinus]MCE0495064.1 AraC family transcriptional regulator [Vibrio salinus]
MYVEALNHHQGYETSWHEHPTGQIFWVNSGVVLVKTGYEQWPVTPGTLGWIPKKLSHKAKFLAEVQGYVIHFSHEDNLVCPEQPGIYPMAPFIQSLLHKTTCIGDEESFRDYAMHITALVGYEIAKLKELPVGLPFPSDRRARNIADELLQSPSNHMTQEQLANKWGLSVRTLSRIFITQTGLTFSQWRQQSKVLMSLQWLQKGLLISEVAELSGYNNISAYIDAFRQRFGETPGKFQSKRR